MGTIALVATVSIAGRIDSVAVGAVVLLAGAGYYAVGWGSLGPDATG